MTEKRPPLSAFMQKEKEEPEQEIKFLRGKAGPKGDTGEIGPEGSRGPQGFRGIPGDDGKDGINGTDGKQGPKGDKGERGLPGDKGEDGINPSIEDLEAVILPLLPDVPEVTPKEIVEKINKGKDKIKASKIEGFNELEGLAKSANKNVQNVLSLGGSRQTAIKVSGTLLGTGINTINFVGATGTKIGDGSEVNVTTSGSGSGVVQTIVAGTGISVNSTDPANPIVSATGTGTPGGLNAQLQYNNAGAFGGITGATTNGTSVSLDSAHLLNPTINGAGTGLATLTYPNTSTSVSIAFPATAGTVALTSQLTSGTVTSASVVTANGFAGTVATATTTPAITLTTSVTGILQGNGTAISAATTTGSGSVVLGTAPTITGATITTSTVNGVTLTTGGSSTTFLNGAGTYTTPAGAGTVTSVASADGSITVTNPTSTVDLAVVKAPIWTTARLLAGNSVNGSANVAFANKFIVQGTTDAGLSGAQFLGALGTGIVKNTTTTGVLSIATGADLPTMTATVGGAVPTPPNNTTTFLRGDGTFATPAGGGTVTNTGGNLTANAVMLGAGTNDSKVVAGITTDGTSVLNLGVNTTTIGKVKMFGNTSGDATIQPAAVAGTATVQTLPATTGTLVNRVTTANGVSASNTDGALTVTLGVITPTSVNSVVLSGSSTPTLAVTGTTAVSGTNTGDQTSVSGNAGTATALQTARTIGIITGDATSAGSTFDGTANNTNALTLATVNSNVGSFTSANITVDAKGRITAASNGSGGTGLTWNTVTGTSQTATVNNGYITNNAGLVTVTLPSTAAVGSIVEVAGQGAGGWLIAQAASVSINFGSVTTTSGVTGSLASTNLHDAIRLLCITANTGWLVLSSIGNITYV